MLLEELNKKEKQINNIQEICRKQEKEIINLISQNNMMNTHKKDSLILMKEIKNKNDFLYDEYENMNKKLNSIKDILQFDENLENMLIEFKNNINNINSSNEDNLINFNKNSFNIENKQYNNNFTFNNKNETISNEFKNSDNNIFILDESNKKNNRNYIYNFSDNQDDITMDKKYDFLFQNKNK